MVVETDDRGSLERALVENIHRSDLNPIEEAAAYRQLIDDGGLTQDALADRLGRNRVTVTNSLRLLSLPTSVQHYWSRAGSPPDTGRRCWAWRAARSRTGSRGAPAAKACRSERPRNWFASTSR